MSEHCYSTLVCAERDKCIFEKMGYTVECSQALTVDGNEIPSSIVMVDREAADGHYEELTTLIGAPFLVCNGARHGVYGDHLLASDGKDWCYVEALHESSYPAVRVDPSGVIVWSEVEEGRKYWGLYAAAVAAIKTAGLGSVVSTPGQQTSPNENPALPPSK